MMRVLIILVALLSGLMFAPELSDNKGYLLISFDSYTTYETTIINASFIAVLFYFVLLAAEWLLRKLLSMSSFTKGWFGQRKTRKAQKNSLLGMIALLEGDFKQAQKLLSKSAEQSEVPGLTYIAAARAAQKSDLFNQRDDLLQLASAQPGCKLAAGLVWIELQLAAKQYENALATLNELTPLFPKNKQICQYYMQTYSALNEWGKLVNLINTQRKLSGLNDAEFESLELYAHQHLFKQLALDSGKLLADYWSKNTPRWMRKELSYQKAMLDAFIENNRAKRAQIFLLEQLNNQFSLPLLPYLQKIPLTECYAIIAFLEKKLKRSEGADYIHQALAYLQMKENHSSAAIKHLIESVKSLPDTKDFLLLANLLDEEGRNNEANQYYRLGLQFVAA